MSLRDPSSIQALAEELLEHQASMSIVWLADHGWQVSIQNPGGSLYVHACTGDEKWPHGEGPALGDVIGAAIAKAEGEGWW